MDERGLRALVCVLVVLGCSVALVPSVSAAVVADAGMESPAYQELNESEQETEDDGAVNESDGADESNGTDDDGNESEQGQNESTALNESDQLDDADEVHIDVSLHENGSATFVVDYRFGNDSTENWEALRDDVEANSEAYAEKERNDWNEILVEGANETGRDMEISDVTVETDTSSAPRNMGHVEFTFRWSSFAHVELNRIEAGDALAGFTLVDDTTLQFFWPEEYAVREIDPSPDDPPDNSIFWDGDGTEFTDEQPWIVLIKNGGTADEAVEVTESPAMPWLAVLGALLLLAAAAAVGWLIRHRADGIGSNDDHSTGSSPPSTETREPIEPGERGTGPPSDLLSNEERVLQLLEERGGRIKQQEIVSELEWTEAKTSQVVSGLREEDEIDVFRIGRENVLAIPEDGDE
ncbi:hypothetical protein EA462_02985 [Natrarchaeobius halalkaliphilus]|uniref:HTH iclR-type domain-containing protein n=1 Tax=Natrarchaeobius halalkaliphilus TaxID=1679091 RepID=A0A3N6MCF9_9EURY|nr:DUF4897 domain-containing protein [Natrarchaeobius halalkaliphilus]RQG93181.1 hypothetical protein EA462_02985 [Natrarchaeobius halalkaliphilus]